MAPWHPDFSAFIPVPPLSSSCTGTLLSIPSWLFCSLPVAWARPMSWGRREGCGQSLSRHHRCLCSQTLPWTSLRQRSSALRRGLLRTQPSNHPPCHTQESPAIGQVSARPLTPASALSAHPVGAGTEWHLWRNPAEGPGPKLQHPLPPPAASLGGPATVGDC